MLHRMCWLSDGAHLAVLTVTTTGRAEACLENTGTKQWCGWEWKHQATNSKMHHSDVSKWEQLCCCLSKFYSSNSASSLKVLQCLGCSRWVGWQQELCAWCGAAVRAVTSCCAQVLWRRVLPFSPRARGLGAGGRNPQGLGGRRARVQDAGETGN